MLSVLAPIPVAMLATLPAPPPSLTVPPSHLQVGTPRPLRERIPFKLTIDTHFTANAPAIVVAAKGAIGPERGRLPRRRNGQKKRVILFDDDDAAEAGEAAAAAPVPVEEPVVEKIVDVGSCAQRLVDGLYVAFAGGAEEGSRNTQAIPRFTHVINVSPERGRPGRASQRSEPNVEHSTDEDGTHRLRLTVPSRCISKPADLLSTEQLVAARSWVVDALGHRVHDITNPDKLKDCQKQDQSTTAVLISTSGLRPGDAMSIVAAYLGLCAEQSSSAPEPVEAETLLRYIDEDESIMGFWKATVSLEEMQVIDSLPKRQ